MESSTSSRPDSTVPESTLGDSTGAVATGDADGAVESLAAERTPTPENGIPESSQPTGELPSQIRVDQQSREHNMARSILFNVVVPLILLGIGVGVIVMLGQVEPEPRKLPSSDRAAMMERLPGVTVMPMYQLDDLNATLELTVDGEVVPYREVTIATEVAGKIVFKSEDCESGNVVQAGDVLMRIDPTDYQLELERLTRTREQSYQSVRESEQERLNTKRLIEVAKRDITLQERDVARQKALKGYSTAVEKDRAERAVLQARQQLVTLENQLESQRQREASLDAALRVAETQLKAAEVNLKRTEVVAPIDGVIVREDAELNTFVARGNPIVTIEDTSKVEVAASLRMDQLYWISNQLGDDPKDVEAGYKLPKTPATIEFEVSGRNNLVYRWEGRLVGYDGIGLDASTRTVPVRILVDNPREYLDDGGQRHDVGSATPLVRGMFVTVGLQVKPQVPLTVIPEKAIKPGNRLWMFRSDESVLNPPEDATDPASVETSDDVAADGDRKTDDTVNSDADAHPDVVAESVFEADDWIAGRVRTVEGIVPVNMLRERFSPSQAKLAKSVTLDSGVDLERKWWICELPDGSDLDQAFVVVSPLGTIPDEGLPARIAKVDDMSSAE